MSSNKKFLLFLGIVVFLFSVFITNFYSPTFSPSSSKDKNEFSQNVQNSPQVLGHYSRTPTLYISSVEGYGVGGMISLPSTAEPSIQITSFDLSGKGELAVYQANEEALLNYLIHDKKGYQLKKSPDISQFQYVTTINYEISVNKEEKILLPIGEKGVWFLHLTLGSKSQDVFLVRSGIGAIVKEGNNEYIFWAQDFKTGRSIEGGTVELYSLLDKLEKVASTSFNNEGVAKTSLLEETDIALVRREEDIAIIPVNLRYLNTEYNYRPFFPKQKQVRYFVFTDRPIYRPGDKVYFKAVMRDDDDAKYSIPSGKALVKIFRNWEEKNPLLEKNYEISPEGTIWGEYQLPTDAKTGSYQLKVEIPSAIKEESRYYWPDNIAYFQVEYFRKPEYSIEINIPSTELIAQDKASFKIKGSYFFGQPLAGQKVKYTVWSADFYEYEYQTNYSYFLSDDYRWGYWGGKKIKEEEVTFDSNGEVEVNLETRYPGEIGKTQVFSIEAQFDDGSGNPSFARKNILVYSGDYAIYRKESPLTFKVGSQLSLPLVLKARRNTEVSGISLEAKIHRENWISYQEADKKYLSYRKEEEELPPLKAVSDNQGNAQFTMTPTKIGSYKFTVSSKDKRGNLITKEFWFWVTAEDQPFYSGEYYQRLNIKADKNIYSPSDTARLTVFSEIPNRDVFLSLERERVHRFQVVKLSGKSKTLEIPLESNDMPNIFANISSFSSDWLNTAETNIEVSSEGKKMVVNLIPDKRSYHPGETLNLNIRTTDTSGKPVSGELAVWAVDKAIFELIDEKPKSVFEKFWGKRYNSTQLAHSLEGIGVFNAERGGGGGGEVRSVFKDTAYWNPSVHTDSDGRAQINFKLPDNLTTWVLFGLGTTLDTKAGQSATEVTVSKDIVIRPVLPNILRKDDKVFLSALVQNFLETEQDLEVSLKFNAGEIKPDQPQKISLKPKELKRVYWEVNPSLEKEKAKLAFSVSSLDKKIGDSLEVEIPIWSFGFWEKSVQIGDGPKEFLGKLSAESDKEKSKVSLWLSPTLLGTLPVGMKYLVYYPYGCTEQTTSYLVPALIAKANPDLFPSSSMEKDIDEVIRKGIKRLSLLQRDDGGWNWWGRGNSSTFVTAYVMEYLYKAKQMGVPINEEVFSLGKKYLEKETSSEEEIIAQTYVLSLIGSEKGKRFLGNLDNLTADYLALAVMANLRNGYKDPQVNGLSKLLSLAKSQGEGIYWEGGKKENFGSVDASTALALRAIVASGEYPQETIKAVRFLVRNRKFDYWSNTFATAQVAQALVDFSKTWEEANPNYTYRVLLNGREIKKGVVTSNKQIIPEIKIPLKELKSSEFLLTVEKEGEGQIYSTLTIEEFRTDKKAQAKSNGLWIKREYLSDRSKDEHLAVGDTVTVKVTVGGLKTEEYYGVIEDQLPSGLIPVNPRFKSEQYGEIDYFSPFPEITENGAILSLYKLKAGEQVYTYKARAVSSGDFFAPPARVSLMYAPEINGQTEVQKIKIEEEGKLIPSPIREVEKNPSNFFVRVFNKILNFFSKLLSFLKIK